MFDQKGTEMNDTLKTLETYFSASKSSMVMSSTASKVRVKTTESKSYSKTADSLAALKIRQKLRDLKVSSSDEELEKPLKLQTFAGVGKSATKRIKQNRKNRTFSFAVSELAKDQKSSNKPLEFKLDKQAMFRANAQKAKQRRINYERKKKLLQDELKKELERSRKITRNHTTRRMTTTDIVHTKQEMSNFLYIGISHSEDRVWRQKKMFKIMAFQTDELSGYPFRQYLLHNDEADMIEVLNLWVAIERMRLDSSQLSCDIRTNSKFRMYLKSFKATYVKQIPEYLEDYISPLLINEIKQLDFNSIFQKLPLPLIRLQRDLFELLENLFDQYCGVEQNFFSRTSMKKCSATKTNKIKFELKASSESVSSQDSSNSQGVEIGSCHPKLQGRIKRSALFLIDIFNTGVDYAKQDDQPDFSDDNGHVQVKKEVVNPVYFHKREMSMQEKYENVKVEYPDPNMSNRKSEKEHYMRSITLASVKVVHRPTHPPKCFADIFKDKVHLEFFKRFLIFNECGKMMSFYRIIETLRTTTSIKLRQQKAQDIMKRYFHNPDMKAQEMLKCDADIIYEIPNLEVVTTSMLFTAQHTIYGQMEKDWFPAYCQTFTERPISVQENIIRPSTMKTNMSKVENPLLVRGLHTLIFGEVVHSADRKTRNLTKWRSVIDWIITCKRFSKAMKEDEKYRTFRYFLQQQSRDVEDGSRLF